MQLGGFFFLLFLPVLESPKRITSKKPCLSYNDSNTIEYFRSDFLLPCMLSEQAILMEALCGRTGDEQQESRQAGAGSGGVTFYSVAH